MLFRLGRRSPRSAAEVARSTTACASASPASPFFSVARQRHASMTTPGSLDLWSEPSCPKWTMICALLFSLMNFLGRWPNFSILAKKDGNAFVEWRLEMTGSISATAAAMDSTSCTTCRAAARRPRVVGQTAMARTMGCVAEVVAARACDLLHGYMPNAKKHTRANSHRASRRAST